MQDIICDPQQGLGPQVEHCCAGADYVCFFLLDKVNVSQCLATVVQGYPQGFIALFFQSIHRSEILGD